MFRVLTVWIYVRPRGIVENGSSTSRKPREKAKLFEGKEMRQRKGGF
jgi:hypothetical protein